MRQIQQSEIQAWVLEGQAHHNRNEADTMRKHLSVIVEQTIKAENLPESVVPYRLSPDGMNLIGEVDIEPPTLGKQWERRDAMANET
jgi:hypothetical protein